MRNSFVTFAKSKKIMPLRGYLVGAEGKSARVLTKSW
jgi:hypothetical protein